MQFERKKERNGCVRVVVVVEVAVVVTSGFNLNLFQNLFAYNYI
jgi:hypothetical protein